MDYKNIGLFIFKLRNNKKITQNELATLLNINPKTISKWENGISVPDTICINKLSKIFNVTVDEIINGKKKKKIFSLKFVILFLIILLLFTFLFIYFFNNYNKIKIYTIKSNDKLYSINGYYIETPRLNHFKISNINYLDDKEHNIKSYKIIMYSDNELYYSMEDDNINMTLNEVLKYININYNDTLKAQYNFKLCIKYIDHNNIEHTNDIKLISNYIYSNRKIIY